MWTGEINPKNVGAYCAGLILGQRLQRLPNNNTALRKRDIAGNDSREREFMDVGKPHNIVLQSHYIGSL